MVESAVFNVGLYSHSVYDIRELYREIEQILNRVVRRTKANCKLFLGYGNYEFINYRRIRASLSPIVHILIAGKDIDYLQKAISDEIQNTIECDIYKEFHCFANILSRSNKDILNDARSFEKKWMTVKHKKGFNQITTSFATHLG